MSRFQDIRVEPELLVAAAQGERTAQRALYAMMAGPMFALVRRVVRDRALAEDVFQDAMVRVFATLGSFRGDAPFGIWLRQVTLNECLMQLRTPWYRARQALRAVLPEEPAKDLPLADLVDLERALVRLPDSARVVLWLHDVEGLTHDEIATAFGRTTSFSKSRLSRAHALLRAQLAPSAVVAGAHEVQGQVV
jgi:RNA polymerase sigma factor (sigma-70 family)